jgi:hypothetical protein
METRLAAGKSTMARSVVAGVALRNIAGISFIETDDFVTAASGSTIHQAPAQAAEQAKAAQAAAAPDAKHEAAPATRWLPNADTVKRYQHNLARVRKELDRVRMALLYESGSQKPKPHSSRGPGRPTDDDYDQAYDALQQGMHDPKLKESHPSPRERREYIIDNYLVPEATQLGRTAKSVKEAIRRRENKNAELRKSKAALRARKGSTKLLTNNSLPPNTTKSGELAPEAFNCYTI